MFLALSSAALAFAPTVSPAVPAFVGAAPRPLLVPRSSPLRLSEEVRARSFEKKGMASFGDPEHWEAKYRADSSEHDWLVDWKPLEQPLLALCRERRASSTVRRWQNGEAGGRTS